MFDAPCPRCHQYAPVSYREMKSVCSVCGAPREALIGSHVQLVGTPSKMGGMVASVLGWTILGVGLCSVLAIALFVQWLFPAGYAGWILFFIVAPIIIALGTLAILSGKKLRSKGDKQALKVREQALFALAKEKMGQLSTGDVAASLSLSHVEAEHWLTEIAKSLPEQISLDVNDEGQILYRFKAFFSDPKWRVDVLSQEKEKKYQRINPLRHEDTEVTTDKNVSLQREHQVKLNLGSDHEHNVYVDDDPQDKLEVAEKRVKTPEK